jgi:hypothetical protein
MLEHGLEAHVQPLRVAHDQRRARVIETEFAHASPGAIAIPE